MCFTLIKKLKLIDTIVTSGTNWDLDGTND